MEFPKVDPIPLPAPVWLMKALLLLTLALHFVAVMTVVGSLAMTTWFNFVGRMKKDNCQLSASLVLSRRLPVLMTYLINLGVPPLLFAQVLYGRALYTSSVLIGVLWISVIGMLIAAYYCIYRTYDHIKDGKAGWGLSLISLILVISIGQIYSMNMTLMLRPEVWKEMYEASPHGLLMPRGDATMLPRWLFVMTGGLVFGGAWAALLSHMKHIDEGTQRLLRRSGGALGAVGVIVQGVCAMLVMQRQPEGIVAKTMELGLANAGSMIYVAGAALALVLGLLHLGPKAPLAASIGGVVCAFLATTGAVLVRDGLRDATLLTKGFDVMDRQVVTNWSVVIIFLLLFVIGLGLVGWLLSIMKSATPVQETVTQ